MNKQATIALAVIFDDQNRVLITQRPMHVSHGGYWEFPGGKIEPNETAEAALIREIQEELGLDILQHQLLCEMNHQYPDLDLKFIVFKVTQFHGQPRCLAGQMEMQWKLISELNPEDFPKANQVIFDLLTEGCGLVK